ncbi:MAG: mannose-1-phosphate guanyltransferase, partial [Verrucomicrobia bacterium]|nr:mannose-1-phosphate guanyltransferase [Verrucomicrobiota bacterium]
SWPALESHFPQDECGNTKIGQVETLNADGNIVYSKDRLTAVIGVKDLIVVQAEGVTLVCPKDRAQDIKQMVVALREKGDFSKLL